MPSPSLSRAGASRTTSVGLAGHPYPSISVPCGLDGAGLPVGLQLTAPVLREPVLFRAANALERDLGLVLRPSVLAGV